MTTLKNFVSSLISRLASMLVGLIRFLAHYNIATKRTRRPKDQGLVKKKSNIKM